MAREPEIIAAYRKAAEAGEVTAQFSLGEAYRQGLKVTRDPAEAVLWLHRAAAQGHPQAGRSLQQMQAQGFDITPPADTPSRHQQSLDELLDSLKPATAPEGDGGMDAPLPAPEPDADPLDLEGGFVDIDSLKQANTPAAWVSLGNAYRLGHGTEVDEVEAVSWYGKAAKANDPHGQYSLALMYDQGLGVRANDSEALRWYLAAAKAGDAEAQYNLANMIRAGRGCPADAKVAEQWYKKAAAQGDAAALFSLGTLYESGHGIEIDSAKAQDFYRQAAAKGVAEAQFNLGNMLRGSDGEAALDFYTQASEQGLIQAQINLGLMLQDSDPTSAAYWLRRAALAGNDIAMLNLAGMHLSGHGVHKDEIEAHLWLEVVAGQTREAKIAAAAQQAAAALARIIGADGVAQSRQRRARRGLGG
ncbi:tetratricopeptide repeat protein [Magnetospirillum sulfuroxidans]|uniref:Sel1 repeat family protein n=1 Tax=Magnetospirillum sulfuroxidans TaxID=611300 RepID=A0ABS5IEL5_9PROT|nr:tetratricopeptide repeat protein [Magnetospirillum sulfuroxidans]MBR9972851.1 sel1 repeat family protein [Magnetospirillum sulfuroxidans]